MKEIAIFCGSFNPPLISHFSLAEQILNEYANIEKVIFVPVSKKYQKEDLIEDEHRYNMLKIECDKNKNLEVSDIELNAQSQLYTIETLRKLQEKYKNYMLKLVIGSDNLKMLDTWHLAESLISEFRILVLQRDNDNVQEIIDNSILLKKHEKSIEKLENIIKINLCSTAIREKIKQNKQVKYLVTDDILDYINNRNLYKVI